MEKIISELNKQLEKGECPKSLNFSIEQQTENIEKFDWDKLKYNTFYKNDKWIIGQHFNPKLFEKSEWLHPLLPYMKKDLEENVISPLDEMEKLAKQ